MDTVNYGELERGVPRTPEMRFKSPREEFKECLNKVPWTSGWNFENFSGNFREFRWKLQRTSVNISKKLLKEFLDLRRSVLTPLGKASEPNSQFGSKNFRLELQKVQGKLPKPSKSVSRNSGKIPKNCCELQMPRGVLRNPQERASETSEESSVNSENFRFRNIRRGFGIKRE